MVAGPKSYSELDPISTPLTGAEVFGVTQAGQSRRGTLNQFSLFGKEIFNVKNYLANGTYNGSDPHTGVGLANKNANNAAFTAAVNAAKAVNGYVYIPAGNYALSHGILATSAADYGIIGEKWRATLWIVDRLPAEGVVNGRIGVDIRQTTVDTQAVIARQPIVDGITINGTWCDGAAIGLRYGPGLHGYINVRIRAFDTITGSPGVAGVTGSIAMLCQNTAMSNGDKGVCEAFTLGPGMRIIECYQGLVYDRGVVDQGHWSIGYQNHQHVLFRDCQTCVLVTNGAWLYHCNVRWEFVWSSRKAVNPVLPWQTAGNVFGVVLEKGASFVKEVGVTADPQPGSRLSGRVQIDAERNDPTSGDGAWTNSCTPIHVDDESMWVSEGWIDVLTACPKLPTCTIAGYFYHTGFKAMSPAQHEEWNKLIMFDGDFNTELNRTGNYTFNVKGNHTRVLQSGTLVRWRSEADHSYPGGLRYGRVDFSDFDVTLADFTTVTLETLVLPDQLPLYIDPPPGGSAVGAGILRGSLEWHLERPVDLPGDLLLEWRALPVCLYESPTTFSLGGDWLRIFTKGVKIKLKQTTYKYFYCIGSSFAAGRTTVTIVGGLTLTNALITSPSFSFARPADFPDWFSYTPSYTGYSIIPASPNYRFKIEGKMCCVNMGEAAGTSNSAQMTMTLPVRARNGGGPWKAAAQIRDSGNVVQQPGMAVIVDDSLVIQMGRFWDATGGFAFGSGQLKNVVAGTVIYEI